MSKKERKQQSTTTLLDSKHARYAVEKLDQIPVAGQEHRQAMTPTLQGLLAIAQGQAKVVPVEPEDESD